jgi:hypothetical protein
MFSTERRDGSDDLKQRIFKRAQELWTRDRCPEGLADEYSEAARDDVMQEVVKKRRRAARGGATDVVDVASRGSFPASDAPAWTPLTGPGSTKR